MDHTNFLIKKWRTDNAPFINETLKNNVTRFYFLKCNIDYDLYLHRNFLQQRNYLQKRVMQKEKEKERRSNYLHLER
jgi:hypothetical protein